MDDLARLAQLTPAELVALPPRDLARAHRVLAERRDQARAEDRRERWKDPETFCFEAHPHRFNRSFGASPWQADTNDIIRAIPDARGPINAALIAPRGGGKSTILKFGAIEHMALNPDRYGIRYFLHGRAKYEQAVEDVCAVRDDIEDNGRIGEVYGDQRTGEWNRGRFVLRCGVLIEAFSLEQNFRGAVWDHPLYGTIRPGFVSIDDPDRDIGTPAARMRLREVFRRGLGGLSGPEGDVDDPAHIMHTLMLGTMVDAHCLAAWLASDESPGWAAELYQAVQRWPDAINAEWAEWEGLYQADRTPDKREALAFYEAHRAEMDRGAEVAWAGDPLYRQMVFRLTRGPAAHASEKQQDFRHSDDNLIQEEWFQYWGAPEDEPPGQWMRTVTHLDPSMGTTTGDYQAIITLSVDHRGHLYVRAADVARRHRDDMMRAALEQAVRTGSHCLRVETIGRQEDDRVGIVGLAEAWGYSMPILEYRPRRPKPERLKDLQPWIRNSTIRFRREQALLRDQLLAIRGNGTSSDHDDGPDALAGALEYLIGYGAEAVPNVRDWVEEGHRAPSGALADLRGDSGRNGSGSAGSSDADGWAGLAGAGAGVQTERVTRSERW